MKLKQIMNDTLNCSLDIYGCLASSPISLSAFTRFQQRACSDLKLRWPWHEVHRVSLMCPFLKIVCIFSLLFPSRTWGSFSLSHLQPLTLLPLKAPRVQCSFKDGSLPPKLDGQEYDGKGLRMWRGKRRRRRRKEGRVWFSLLLKRYTVRVC